MRRATLSGAESARASHGGFAPSVSASAYFDAPSAPPRVTVEPTRLTRSFHATRRTAGYDDAWTGVYGEHGGVGKSAVRLSAVPALARALPDDGARPGGADGRTTPLNELELDVNTANVLAKQQAQLLELHAQVESLKAQLSRSRGRAAGTLRDGGSLRTSSEWHARGGGANANANAVDASTNTLWRPDMARDVAKSSRPETEPADAWSYEGGGRKSRGTATDGDGGGGSGGVRVSADEHVACTPASADDPMRRSSRSGLRVIRRSFAGRPGDAAAGTSAAGTSAAGTSAPRLSPAKPSDLAADASSASAAEPAFASMPPLPPPSRPDMRALRRRELVTDRDGGEDEPAGRAYAPPPTATDATKKDAQKSEAGAGDGTTDAFERGFGEGRGFETTDFARASFSASSRRLIPSQNSAFTPVAGEALGGDGRATALRAAERAAETRASRSESAEDRDARRVGVDRGFFEPASFDIGTDVCAAPGSNDDTHKMRVVVPPRAFARVPLFAEGDGSPSSPGRGDDDADSEVLRVSRDTFAELSLRGAAEGARSEEGDEPDVEDDGTDAGTAVTGTTAGRGASEWALPARWGPSQRMSEEVCWENEEGRDFGARGGSGDGASTPSGRTSPAVDDASYLSPRALLGGGSPRRSPRRARSSDSDSERERERERDYARPIDAAADDVPTIAYQPMSDDESSDDEEMRAIYAKYSVGATTR